MEFYLRFAHFVGSEAVELAALAEELGIDGLLLSDHVFFPVEPTTPFPYVADGRHPFGPEAIWPDLFVTVGALSSVTTTLRFLTAVYLLPLRDPLLVAKSLATASIYSGGRLSLGVGAGWMRDEYDVLGVDFASRGRRMDEAIEVVRKVLSHAPSSHDGEFFHFPDIEMRPLPEQVPPILVGGPSGTALERAARLGDGYVGVTLPPADVSKVVADLRARVAAAGRDPDGFPIYIGCTEESTAEDFEQVARAGATGMYVIPWPNPTVIHTPLAEKRAALERLAMEIRRFREREGLSAAP